MTQQQQTEGSLKQRERRGKPMDIKNKNRNGDRDSEEPQKFSGNQWIGSS